MSKMPAVSNFCRRYCIGEMRETFESFANFYISGASAMSNDANVSGMQKESAGNEAS